MNETGYGTMMNRFLTTFALVGLLGVAGVGCSSSPCDDLADEYEAGGCVPEGSEQADVECSGAVEKAAQCYLDNVADACSPTEEELEAIAACQGG